MERVCFNNFFSYVYKNLKLQLFSKRERVFYIHIYLLKKELFLHENIRATPAVSQNRKQKPFLDAKGEKRCSSSGAIAGTKIWLLNSDKPNLTKYS